MNEKHAQSFHQRAREMEERAESARTDELRQFYLVLAREWHNVANRQPDESFQAIAPIGALECLAPG
jgi:hypothetical protein